MIKTLKENKKNILVLLIFIIAYLFLHKYMFICGDDIGRYEKLHDSSIIPYCLDKIKLGSTSSRFAIEFVFCFFVAKLPIICWHVADICLTTIAAVFLYKTIYKEWNPFNLGMTLCVFLLFPFWFMSTAGWVACTTNYWWEICLGIIGFSYIFKFINGETVSFLEKIAAVLLLLFACDNELANVMVIVVLFGIAVFAILEKKQFRLTIISLIVSLFRFLLHAVWKKFDTRAYISVIKYFPDYYMRTIFDKAQAGFSSANYLIFKQEPFLMLLLSVLLAILIFVKYKDYFHRIISLVPLSLVLAEGILRDMLIRIFPYIEKFDESYSEVYGVNDYLNYFYDWSYISLFIWGFALICIIICLISIFDKKSIIYISIFVGGLLSRVAMGFSPTIEASSYRAYSFLVLSLLLLICVLLKDITNKTKYRDIIAYMIIFMVSTSYITNLMYAIYLTHNY